MRKSFIKGKLAIASGIAVLVTGPGSKKAGYACFSGVVVWVHKDYETPVDKVGTYSDTWSNQAFNTSSQKVAEFFACLKDGNNAPVTEDAIIKSIDDYRKSLYESKTVSPTRFQYMQTALHGVKNIIRDHFGSKRKGDTAWVKN